MGRKKEDTVAVVNRKLFQSFSFDAKITNNAASVIWDKFEEYIKDAYLNKDELFIYGFGRLMFTPAEDVIRYNPAIKRHDYMVVVKKPKIKMSEALKKRKREEFKKKKDQK